jgi:hypothetical protein
VLLAAAAGAIASDVHGRPWTLGLGSLVASGSQQVHDEILACSTPGRRFKKRTPAADL